MAEVAKLNDLQAHIKADSKLVHGIWDLVLARISGVYNALWRDNTNDDADDVYIQSGRETCQHDVDKTVTFDVAFTAAPRVVATAETTDQNANVVVHTVGTASFKIHVFNATSGSDANVAWIAIGRKDR